MLYTIGLECDSRLTRKHNRFHVRRSRSSVPNPKFAPTLRQSGFASFGFKGTLES